MKLDVNYAEKQFKIAVDFEPEDIQNMSDAVLEHYKNMIMTEVQRRSPPSTSAPSIAPQLKALKGRKKPRGGGGE